MTPLPLPDGILFVLFIAILALLLLKPRIQQLVRESRPEEKLAPQPAIDDVAADDTRVHGTRVQTTTTTETKPDPSIGAHDDVSHAQATCFRISGIPINWDSNRLRQALRDMDPELYLPPAELSELFPACCDTSQVALLTLERCTAYFQNFKHNDERQKVFAENGRKIRLVFDKHFYDLTPMNRPTTPIVTDVIAITGLGGHAFGSWRSRTTTDRPVDRPMWLRDFLPLEITGLRIMTYGYDSSLKNPNGANLTDYRRNFIECIQNARRDCSKRPIIFFGHSLGGILVVQTLVESRKHTKHRGIFDCIRGIFFFGTPHQGLRTVELDEMAGELDDMDSQLKVRNLLAQLREGSEYLENQKDDLSEMWGKFRGKVFTFYETEKTKSVKKLGSGVFGRAGNEVQMVQRLSAQLYLPRESRFPIASNHTDMVKFDSSQDRAFQTVVTSTKECVGA